MTPLDRLLAFRTLRIELVLIVLALIVGAATDEASASWADRATRLAAMTPILAAASVGIVLAQLRRRGELEALTLAGASPARVALGALVSAVLTAQLGALAIAAGLPLRSLFPASRGAGWVREANAFVLASKGVAIPDAGSASFGTPLVHAELTHPRWPTSTVISLMALICPWWVTLDMPGAERVVVGSLAVLVELVGFQVTASHQAAWGLFLGPSVLFAHGWMRSRRSRVMFAR